MVEGAAAEGFHEDRMLPSRIGGRDWVAGFSNSGAEAWGAGRCAIAELWLAKGLRVFRDVEFRVARIFPTFPLDAAKEASHRFSTWQFQRRTKHRPPSS